jgi:hypothetical protein
MNTILVKMLDRLLAGLASGPNLNCRPHSSRQRIDWTQLSRLKDISPAAALCQLLSDKQSTRITARVEPPKSAATNGESSKGRSRSKSKLAKPESVENADEEAISSEEKNDRSDWSAQQSLLAKIRVLAEDAREYEQDTGVHVLHVGFPLLSLPSNLSNPLKSGAGGAKRLLAPIAFVPVKLELRAGLQPVISIEGLHDGADFLVPNEALFAWLERQTGRAIMPASSAGATGDKVDQKSASGTSEPADDTMDAKEPTQQPAEASQLPSLDPWVEVNDLVQRFSGRVTRCSTDG